MELPFFLKTLLTIFILITTFPSSRCEEDDENFTKCGLAYDCGPNVKNLSFPFWGDYRPQNCGHVGFQLHCVNGEYPVININELEYRVLRVVQENHTMTLARLDLWDTPCSPNLEFNTTLNPPFFNDYTQGVVNLTLFYECSGVDFPYNFTCAGQDISVTRDYYVNDSFLEKFPPNVTERCTGGVLQTLIFEAAFKEDPGNGLDELRRTFQVGFGVNYTNFPLCTACESSGGRCGSGDGDNPFCCFCRTGREDYVCPTHTSGDEINWKAKLGIGVGCGFGGIILMCIVFLIYVRRKRKQNAPKSLLSRDISSDFSSVKDMEKGSTYFGVHLFTYEELAEATNNFDSSKELGDGGFGTVYYGKLHDGRVVAVKRLYENNCRRVEQFMNEIGILAHLRHNNLVSLYGCTSRHAHELLLVYEYIPNGTVADHLHGERAKPGALPWAIRLNIAIETASALTYLHASEVVHRDVKTNNILLDNNFCVKVADFGLSRLFPLHMTHVSTAPQGTPGYVDPEYHHCYQLTSKSDVFSFGVVLMELVSSMPAVDITRHRHDINLSTMAMNRIQNHALHEIVDPSLGFDTDSRVRKMITSVAELAFQCLQHEKDMRPNMADVLEELKAIQTREYSMGRAEKIETAADDAVLLKSGPQPFSPDSVTINWTSRATTPNASG